MRAQAVESVDIPVAHNVEEEAMALLEEAGEIGAAGCVDSAPLVAKGVRSKTSPKTTREEFF